VLSELLSSLEREVEILHSKYCEAYVILIDVMERLARLTSSLSPTDIIKEK
jgi:predicted house-cleaning noncanonical NTP pyrophosphatase (MazG superfamily)